MVAKDVFSAKIDVGTLRVWWIAQIPLKKNEMPFFVSVKTIKEAKKIIEILSMYDFYQLEHKIKPDYSNAGGLQEYDGKEWVEWEDEEGRDIDEIMRLEQ